jgi:hypothetical protein
MKHAKVINFRVPEYEFRMLSNVARKRKCTHSAVIRTALLLYFESLKETPAPDLEKTISGEDLLRSLGR